MGLGKGVALVVSIVGDTAGLSKTLDAAGVDVKGFGGDALATAAKVSVIGGAALAAGAAIFEMADAAASDRAEQQKLSAAIAAVGAETANTTQQVDDAIAAGQAKAFTDSETRDALQALVTSTKDVGAATALLSDAQNIARLAGVDLATASEAVAKANSGNDKALRSLIPGLEKGATATDTLANASKAAAGQADIFANSTDGMKARAGDAFGELTETIGEVFLPILDAVIPALLPILDAFGKLIKALLPALIPLIKLLAGAFKIAADILVKLIDILSSIFGWIMKLLEPIGKLVDQLGNLNPFSGFKLPSFGSATVGVSTLQNGASTFGATGSSGGGVTFNIYGDPSVIEAKVTKALRDYSRRNGIASVLVPGNF